MEVVSSFNFDVVLKPDELVCGVDTSKHLGIIISERYKDTIYKGVVILHISEVNLSKPPKVLTSGDIKFFVDVTCKVLKVEVGDKLDVVVTNSNNMGAFWKQNCMTVFIPKHLTDNDTVPNTGECKSIEIVGKRVTDKIVCVAKIVESH